MKLLQNYLMEKVLISSYEEDMAYYPTKGEMRLF